MQDEIKSRIILTKWDMASSFYLIKRNLFFFFITLGNFSWFNILIIFSKLSLKFYFFGIIFRSTIKSLFFHIFKQISNLCFPVLSNTLRKYVFSLKLKACYLYSSLLKLFEILWNGMFVWYTEKKVWLDHCYNDCKRANRKVERIW